MPEHTALRVEIVLSGLPQYEVARRAGLTDSKLSRYLRGRDPLDPETAQRIRDAIATAA